MLDRIKKLFRNASVDKTKRVTTDDLLKKDYSLYSDTTLDFVLCESEKSLTDTLIVFRKINDISFAILSVYLAILGFGINKIISSISLLTSIDVSVIIIMLGTIRALSYLWPNLWEGDMWEIGVKPSVFINEDYEGIDLETQLKFIKIQKLALNQNGIYYNRDQNALRNRNIKYSVYSLIIAFLLGFLYAII